MNLEKKDISCRFAPAQERSDYEKELFKKYLNNTHFPFRQRQDEPREEAKQTA